jgi:DNA-binding CsgD family transcriptional regulator
MDIVDYSKLINLTEEVVQLCAPIKKHFNVTYFNYVRLNNDNSRCLLTDRPDWLVQFYQEKFYNARTTLDIEALKYQQYFSWEMLKDEFTFQEASKHDISNGITLIEPSTDYLDLYWFGTTNENTYATNNFESNIDAFQRFILYFKDKGSKVLNSAHINPINFGDYENEKGIYTFKTFDQLINTFTHAENLRFIFEHQGEIKFLSQQETICASYFILQFSMREIAVRMQISPRTVETYVNNIKNKLFCNSKSNLISELLNLKIANIDDPENSTLFYSYDISQLLTLRDFINETTFKRVYVNNGIANLAYLTQKECEVLLLFCRGLNPKNIATRFNCTAKTIESYLDSLKTRFLVRKKSDLVSICVGSGLLYRIMIAFPDLVNS